MQAATIGGDSVDRRRRGERERQGGREGRGGGEAEADVSPNGRRVSEPPTDFSCFGRLIGAEFKGAGGESVKSPEGLLNAERELDDCIATCCIFLS